MIRIACSIAASIAGIASSAVWAQAASPAAPASVPSVPMPVQQQPMAQQQVQQPAPHVVPQQTAAPAASAPAVPVVPVAPVVPQYNQPPVQQQLSRTPPPPAPPTPPVKGLPADAPKLVINGGIYSERRDMRMAIVNGNVVREGQEVNGVVVEQIRPEGVVLAYRGSRVHVLY